jgi:hypothetical protein
MENLLSPALEHKKKLLRDDLVSPLETKPVTVTVSLGVALADLPVDLDLIKLDAFLEILIRNAKNAGRNSVVFFENES